MIKDILKEKSQSDELFIIVDKQLITYRKFDDLVNNFIQRIEKIEYRIHRLAIALPLKLDVLIAIIGCNRLNIIPIILPPSDKRIPDVNYENISNADSLTIDNNCIIQLKDKKNILDNQLRHTQIQCVLFTSGSESTPKAVELTYDNILSSASNWNHISNFNKGEYYLNILPLHHIAGLSVFFRSIYFGFISVVFDYDKDAIIKQILEYKIDYISLVPKMIYNMINKNQLKVLENNIKMIIVGGDGVNQYIYNHLKNNNLNTYLSYGMTETSSGVSGYFINKKENFEDGFIGDAHESAAILLENGYIAIKSNVVMHKYVNDVVCNNKFITKDLGELQNGKVYFLSREKDLIVSGGENISLNKIKNTINTCGGVIDSVVVSYKDDKWGRVPVVLFESNVNQISIEQLSAFCKEVLPNYMVPKHFIKINKIPYKNNKIDNQLIKYYVKQSIK